MSGVTAGDYVLIYDGGIEETNAGAWPVLKMDVPVGVAYTPSVVMIPQGLSFTKEIYVDLHLTGNGRAQVFYTE